MTNQTLFGCRVIAIAMASCLFLFSCSEDNSEQTPLDTTSKYVAEPIVLPTSSLEWDESYHPDSILLRSSSDKKLSHNDSASFFSWGGVVYFIHF